MNSNGRRDSLADTRDDHYPSQQNQNQGSPSEPMPRHMGGMTARERRYMRERRRARTHSHLLGDSGAGNLRVALLLRSLLDETMTLDIEHTWRVLFPDDGEIDVVDDEADAEDVEAVEDMDVAQDMDGAAW